MKIIAKDNYNRDTINDILIAENVANWYADKIVNFLNNFDKSDRVYTAENDDYKLYKYEN